MHLTCSLGQQCSPICSVHLYVLYLRYVVMLLRGRVSRHNGVGFHASDDMGSGLGLRSWSGSRSYSGELRREGAMGEYVGGRITEVCCTSGWSACRGEATSPDIVPKVAGLAQVQSSVDSSCYTQISIFLSLHPHTHHRRGFHSSTSVSTYHIATSTNPLMYLIYSHTHLHTRGKFRLSEQNRHQTAHEFRPILVKLLTIVNLSRTPPLPCFK